MEYVFSFIDRDSFVLIIENELYVTEEKEKKNTKKKINIYIIFFKVNF
jgi:hypothetical protein